MDTRDYSLKYWKMKNLEDIRMIDMTLSQDDLIAMNNLPLVLPGPI